MPCHDPAKSLMNLCRTHDGWKKLQRYCIGQKFEKWKFYARLQKKIVLNNVTGCGSSVPMKLLLITIFTCTFLRSLTPNPFQKNIAIKKYCVKHELPVFATEKKISYIGGYQTTNGRETKMMSVRWKYFEFKKQIPDAEQKDIQPFGKCFTKLSLLGEIV